MYSENNTCIARLRNGAGKILFPVLVCHYHYWNLRICHLLPSLPSAYYRGGRQRPSLPSAASLPSVIFFHIWQRGLSRLFFIHAWQRGHLLSIFFHTWQSGSLP